MAHSQFFSVYRRFFVSEGIAQSVASEISCSGSSKASCSYQLSAAGRDLLGFHRCREVKGARVELTDCDGVEVEVGNASAEVHVMGAQGNGSLMLELPLR